MLFCGLLWRVDLGDMSCMSKDSVLGRQCALHAQNVVSKQEHVFIPLAAEVLLLLTSCMRM
jgi:hypothetical protein